MLTIPTLTKPLQRQLTRLVGHWTAWQRPPAAPAPLSRAVQRAPATYKHDLGIRRVTSTALRLDTGEYRALLEVTGMPLESHDAASAEAFLGQLAGVLNALRPRGVQMVARSRPGGFTRHLHEREQAAMALRDPAQRQVGTAQVRHYQRMATNGDARALHFYVVVPGKRERELEHATAALINGFGQIGLPLRRVAGDELSLVLGEWWRGQLPTHWYYRLGDATLNVAPHAARVTAK